MKIEVCMGTNCMMNGSMSLYDQLQSLEEIVKENPDEYIDEDMEINVMKCKKICKKYDNYKYCHVRVNDESIENKENREIVEYIMNLIKK